MPATPFPTTTDLLTDPQLEAAMLVAIAGNPAIVDLLRDLLQPADFATTELAQAFAAALEGEPFPVPAGDPAPNLALAARRLADLSGARKLDHVPRQLARGLLDVAEGRRPLDDVIADFSAAAGQGIEAATPSQPLQPAGALVGDVLAGIQERHELRNATGSAVTGLRTGIPQLDDMTGGLEGGTITIVQAAPNVGKSTLVNSWAYNVAREGAPVLFLSFENPASDLVRKNLLRLANRSGIELLQGKIPADAFTQAAQTFSHEVGSRLYYVTGTATTDMTALRAMAYRIRKRHPEARSMLICVDYVQKWAALKPTGDGPRGAGFDDMRGTVTQLLQQLRDVARELHSPVLAVGSVGRQAYDTEKARPTIASGSESRSVEYDADTLLLLSEDREYDGPLSQGTMAMRLELAKSRYGPRGVVPLFFNPAGARYTLRDASSPTIGLR